MWLCLVAQKQPVNAAEKSTGALQRATFAEAFDYKVNKEPLLGLKAFHLFFKYLHNQQQSAAYFEQDLRTFSKMLEDRKSLAFDLTYKGAQSERDFSDWVLEVTRVGAPGVVGKAAGVLEVGKKAFTIYWDDYVQRTMSPMEKKLWLFDLRKLQTKGFLVGTDIAGLYAVDSKFRSLFDTQIVPLLGFSPNSSIASIEARNADYFGTVADKRNRSLLLELYHKVDQMAGTVEQKTHFLLDQARAKSKAFEDLRRKASEAKQAELLSIRDEIRSQEDRARVFTNTATLLSAILQRSGNKELVQAGNFLSQALPLYELTGRASLEFSKIALQRASGEISASTASSSNSYLAANLAMTYVTFGLSFVSSAEAGAAESQYKQALLQELREIQKQVKELTEIVSVGFSDVQQRLGKLSVQMDDRFRQIEQNQVILSSQVNSLSHALAQIRSEIFFNTEVSQRELRELLDEPRVDLIQSVLERADVRKETVMAALFSLKQLAAVHSGNAARSASVNPAFLTPSQRFSELSKHPSELNEFLLATSDIISPGPPAEIKKVINPAVWDSATRQFISIVATEDDWSRHGSDVAPRIVALIKQIEGTIVAHNEEMAKYFDGDRCKQVITAAGDRYTILFQDLEKKYAATKTLYSQGSTTIAGKSLKGVDLADSLGRLIDLESSPDKRQSFNALVGAKSMKPLWANSQCGIGSIGKNAITRPRFRPPHFDHMQRIPEAFSDNLDPIYKIGERLGAIDIQFQYIYGVWEDNRAPKGRVPFSLANVDGQTFVEDLAKTNSRRYMVYPYRIILLAVARYQGRQIAFHIGHEDPNLFSSVAYGEGKYGKILYFPILDDHPTAWDDDYIPAGKALRGLQYCEKEDSNYGLDLFYNLLKTEPAILHKDYTLHHWTHFRTHEGPGPFTPQNAGFEFFAKYFTDYPEPNSPEAADAERLKTLVLKQPQFQPLEVLFDSSRDKVHDFRESLTIQIEDTLNAHRMGFTSDLLRQIRDSPQWVWTLEELAYLRLFIRRLGEICFANSLATNVEIGDLLAGRRQLPDTQELVASLLVKHDSNVQPLHESDVEKVVYGYSKEVARLPLKYEVPSYVVGRLRDLALAEYMLTNNLADVSAPKRTKATVRR